jgi:hypothetical protein
MIDFNVTWGRFFCYNGRTVPLFPEVMVLSVFEITVKGPALLRAPSL